MLDLVGNHIVGFPTRWLMLFSILHHYFSGMCVMRHVMVLTKCLQDFLEHVYHVISKILFICTRVFIIAVQQKACV